MKTRFPVISTIVVAICVLTMIALGIWQLHRAGEKEAYLALLASNKDKPAMAYPLLGPLDDANLFRKSSLVCLKVTDWQTVAGRAADGSSGQRYIARCSTGAEGPGALVVVGVTRQLVAKPQWAGGPVNGVISSEPDTRNVLMKILGNNGPLNPMLIATDAIPGFEKPALPSIEQISNNHLAYAVQWFLFAAVAAVIYVLAVRRRGSDEKS